VRCIAGIGTYIAGQYSNTQNQGFFASLKISWAENMDSMFGTSFVEHVVAGYKFLLQYYAPGDKIYIFGFSRGAYTARFLSEMIDNIGLLSRGNEEMVQFAWNTFSDYQRLSANANAAKGVFNLNHQSGVGGTQAPDSINVADENQRKGASTAHGAGRGLPNMRPKPRTQEDAKAYMEIFSSTFCRPGVRIYFLGLFDCVNSVSSFDITKKSSPYLPSAPARHIRHAVSIGERRSKFRPALFLIDDMSKVESLKEVWFSGNHGDCGGGWWLERLGQKTSKYLLSDIPLRWMLEEVRQLDEKENVSAVTSF
jgi:uncharacterized protein (DUF2235 family)